MTKFAATTKDLGDGFHVRRILPHLSARMVGPFVFVDHFGPAEIKQGNELTVRPHPHIGLATITYLYDGQILHKDSLGNETMILPGEVNWMTAGEGIVHSEHSRLGNGPHQLEGIQTWVALPKESEDCAPDFTRYSASSLPVLKQPGVRLCLIAGEFMGMRSPVRVLSPLFYADLMLEPKARYELAFEANWQNACYVSRGAATLGDIHAVTGEMVIATGRDKITVETELGARLVLLGGAALTEPRFIWWNFVSSNEAKIERAKSDWRENKMGIVSGETDRIPLPGNF